MIAPAGAKTAGPYLISVRWKKPDQEYRGCTVHCYRFVHSGEEYATKPDEWSLAPEFKELWGVLERINSKLRQKGARRPFRGEK